MKKIKLVLGDELWDILPAVLTSCLVITGIITLIVETI
jgi:hypothetical protein